ncbi:MAG: NAD-dependent epimerase/dehydratase family protein, partial [Nanoarchaeota archaeon]
MIDNKFKGKTILITGADGFIGSYLVEEFFNRGAKVIAFARSRYLKNLNQMKGKIDIIYQDLTKKEAVYELERFKPDYIFHLAGFIKSDSYENPTEILETNVMGTINVIEAASKIPNLKRIFYFSSGEVYGECVNADEN